SCSPVSRAPGVPIGQRRQPPGGFPFVPTKYRRRTARFERVWQAGNPPYGQRGVSGCLPEEPGDGFGHQPSLLGLCPTFNEHRQVEVAGRKTLEGVLADAAERLFIDWPEQALLQVRLAEVAG